MKEQNLQEKVKLKDVAEIKSYIRRKTQKLRSLGFVEVHKKDVRIFLDGQWRYCPYTMFLNACPECIDLFIRDCDAQRKDLDRQSRCQVKGKKGKAVICGGDCNNCPNSKRSDGERIGFRQGGPLSTELMLEDGLDIPDKNNPYEHLENEERIGALHKAVEQLPDERNRKIAQLLLEDEQLSERGIAEKMNVCQKSVNNRYHKTCDFLSEALKDYR